MSEDRRGLLAIGRFSERCGLSQKALRLYDEIGLLRPVLVDRDSGYRYYAAEQLERARLVALLRSLEMPLAVVADVLDAPDRASAAARVQRFWRDVEERHALRRRALSQVLTHLQKEATMGYEVRVKDVPEQPVLSITQNTGIDGLEPFIDRALAALYAHLREAEQEPAGPALGIYHGPVNEEDDGPVQVCVPLAAPLDGTGDIRPDMLAGATVAYVLTPRKDGQFPEVLAGYDAIWDWAKANGHELTAPPREIWLADPRAEGDAEEPVFEIAWPLG
jgi:DNA-binding transcriptional MerR regulator